MRSLPRQHPAIDSIMACVLTLLIAWGWVISSPGDALAETSPPAQPIRSETVELTLFWEPGCPFCKRARDFLQSRPETRDWLHVNAIDLSTSRAAVQQFERAIDIFGIRQPGVPLIIIGQQHFIGFDDPDHIGKALLEAAGACRHEACVTFDRLLARGPAEPRAGAPAPSATIDLPWVGTLPLASFSLPVLTVVLAAVDGFNPCAMWVLIFLVGLLLGIQDRMRMWLLGGAFLLASGVVYFLFLAAWLNVFLVLGTIFWIRLAVGLIALASGLYYLHAFATNAAAECRVTNLAQRQRIMASLRASVSEPRFMVALSGIVVLAAAVNLIELFCSAGIPAVYTDVLAANALPDWEYYLYLLLYVAVFMLDDAIIFTLAMITLHATSMTNRYLRVSHLIGGLGMITVGVLLLVAPDWLAFVA
jgi:glutaredoxin